MKKIGKYEIQDKLGSGGMGIVYKAIDPLMERVVAIKTMSDDLDSEPLLRERFFREARSAGQLSHKNIVTIYDLGEEGRIAYIAMEYLDGEDLKHKMDRGEKISVESAVQLISEVCDGLAHAHHRGVIHRDVKPSNIHVTRQGHVKIMDFGLAKIASSNITKTGIAMGTPNYMSPEQAKGEKIDQRSDIFSVGAVFYELLSRRKPFDPYSNYDWRQVFFKIIFEEPEPLAKFNPAIPSELDAIVRRAMAKEPADRYAQIDELHDELEEFLKLLDDRKRRVQDEAREAVDALDRLMEANRSLLRSELGRGGAAEETAVRPSLTHGFLELVEIRDEARSELARLTAVLEEKKRLDAEWARATALEREGKLDLALELGEKILKALPGHPEARALVERTRKGVEAQGHFGRGDFEACLKTLTELGSGNSEASALRDRAEAALAMKKQEDEAEAFLQEAATFFAQEDLEGCLTRLDKVLRIRPGHTAAAALQEKALERQKGALAYERRRQAAALLEEARRALGARDLVRAAERAARARETEPELRDLRDLDREIERARQEREARVATLLTDARASEKQNEERALALVAELLGLAPGHADALELKRSIERRQRERQNAISEKLEKARKLERQGDFTETLVLIRSVLKLDDSHPEARELEKRAAEARARARQASLEEARKALARGEWAAAEEVLLALIRAELDEGEAERLLDQARKGMEEDRERKRKIAEGLARARELERGGNFDETLVLVRSVLKLDDSHAEAREIEKRAQEAKERLRVEEAARKLLARAEVEAGRDDPRGAAELLETAEPAVAARIEVKEVRERFQAAQKRQERAKSIQANLEDGKRAFKKGDVEGALRLAEQASRDGRPDTALREVERVLALEPVNDRARTLKKRVERHLEDKRERDRKRRQAVALLGEASVVFKAGDASRARKLLDEAEALAPDLAPSAELRRQIEKMERGRGASAGLVYAAAAVLAVGVVVAMAVRRFSTEEQIVEPVTTSAAFEPKTSALSSQESDAIRNALERYREAMEGKNLGALRAVYPGLTLSAERTLSDTLTDTDSLQVELRCGEPQVDGTAATVECARVERYVFKNRRTFEQESTATFRLEKRDFSWVVVELSGTAK